MMSILPVAVAFALFAHVVFAANHSCTTSDDMVAGHNLSGKVAVLTGGDSGVALPTSISLAASGAVVVLAVHNQEHGDAVAANISKQTGNPKVSALHIDLGSFASVRTFASNVLARQKVFPCPHPPTRPSMRIC